MVTSFVPIPRANGALTFYLCLSLSYVSRIITVTVQSIYKKTQCRKIATQEDGGGSEPRLTWVKSFPEEVGEKYGARARDTIQNRIARCESRKMKDRSERLGGHRR